jgi:hypothetical protein
VEINGDDRHNLHLFANPMETNAPSPSDVALKGSGSIRGRGIISGGRNSKCYGGGTTKYGGYVNLDGGVTNLEGFIILNNTSWMITVIDSESLL